MANETEPRALGAALAAPAFVTRGHTVAMHAANRHVERWAPEADTRRVRSIRSLGFVDRLVAPWLETAQRSGSLRLFNQYASTGLGERAGSSVSWVFPRPWYQDELDWMAAARRSGAQAQAAREAAPTLLTTRGTYVAPSAPGAMTAAPGSGAAAAPRVALPAALYEHVAPSLSLAASRPAPIAGVGFGGEALPRGEAYSPLIPLAAVQAAELMTRTVAPLLARRAPSATAAAPVVTPALRSVLSSVLARAAVSRGEAPASRVSTLAPALVTPPAPRPDAPAAAAEAATVAGSPATPSSALSQISPMSADAAAAVEVAEQYAAQRARIAELQRIAQQAAARELAARAEAARPSSAASAAGAAVAPPAELRSAAERAEAELRQRTGRPADAPRAASADEIERARAAQPASPVGEAPRPIEAQRRAEVQQQAEAQQQADAAERARIEERIAQRLAERSAAQRLHEQARAEAAAHARAAIEPARTAARPVAEPVAAPRTPAEVTAAIAGLPPELAALLGSAVAQRPERTLQAIGELNESLRSVELLARSSAAGVGFEVTRGPRLVMPAGLGGLVSAVDRAQSIAERPAVLGGQRPLAPLARFAAPDAATGASPEATVAAARAAGRELRVPHLAWLAAAPAPQTIAASSALGATAATAPAALGHVAWADRWLARFAGATPQSLDMISATGAAAPAARMRALASAAPGVVFVAPELLRGDRIADPAAAAVSAAASAEPAAPASAATAPGPQRIPSPPVALRFDDEGETPDDVFTAIAAAASRGRTAPARPSTFIPAGAGDAAAARAAAPTAPRTAAADRPMLADLIAHAAPSAPGAGLSAQLASSPFAAALRHVVSLPSAASFDVRSLFGADLGAVYLAGLIGPATRELAIGAQSAPAWAAWREAPALAERGDRIDRTVPGFEAAYVAPETSVRGEIEPGGAAAPGGATAELGAAAPATAAGVRETTAAALTTLRSALLSWELTAAETPAAGVPGALRWTPSELAAASPSAAAPLAAPAGDAGTARRMIDAMSLPMLGEATTETPSAWSAPGMLAERAQTWSVAQERSASDLALDFVTPELVLAARVYGLGATEAAQAARLAIVGPGQLGAMASTIDRTFVEALAIGRDARLETERHRAARETSAAARDRRPGVPGLVAVAPDAGGELAAASSDAAASPAIAGEARAAITTAFPTAGGGIAAAVAPVLAAPASTGAAFGVDRRSPRGAFLWPSATVAALGMNAAVPDGQLSASVAALELLAAQVVAEIGTFTALADARTAALGLDDTAAPGSAAARAVTGAADLGPAGAVPAAGSAVVPAADEASAAGAPAGLAARAAIARREAALVGRDATRDGAPAAGAEPREADVLGAAAAMVPAARRARFEALYVALGQSPGSLSWSPAARAARALALVGRGEDGPVSPRERAATAWDVLPVVYAGDAGAASSDAPAAAAETGAASASAAAAIAQAMTSHVAPVWLGGPRAAAPRTAGGRAARLGPGGRDVVGAGEPDAQVQVTGAGLSALSARAGQALGSYIAPAAPPVAPRDRPVDMTPVGAVLRPPTAEPEYVQTGSRTGGRYGGGEVEIPPWFEAAARKMLSERSDGADGISLAELTLVTAAPASHIAAAPREHSAPPSPGAAAAAQQQSSTAPQIDIEKLANEVYRNILVLMDIARARNGNPYL